MRVDKSPPDMWPQIITAVTGGAGEARWIILMPLASYVTPGNGGYLAWKLGKVEIGVFHGDLVNFLILAVAMFVLIVMVLGAVQKVSRLENSDEPVINECPYFLSMIPANAIKCAHYTSELSPQKREELD